MRQSRVQFVPVQHGSRGRPPDRLITWQPPHRRAAFGSFAAFGDFDLECLPNRDSRPYRAKYGLDDAEKHPVGYSTYFNWSMVAYVMSLIATLIAMIYMEAAQPALLYIVPFVIGASMLVALARGEMTELWAFEVPGAEEGEGPIVDMVHALTDGDGNAKRRLTKADVDELRKLLDEIVPEEDDENEEVADSENKKDQ